MSIPPEQSAQILRLYQVEGWSIGTIANHLQLHHSTITRHLHRSDIPVSPAGSRTCQISPYLPFIQQLLEKYPRLTAARIFQMIQARGYPGSARRVRHFVSTLRPKPAPEAFLRLRTLPGEQAQVDWGHFGHVMVGRAKRPLMGFVMVLSYSRRIFLHFSLNAKMESFLQGHHLAFTAWGGVPRVVLCDNLKSAVLDRRRDTIRFNPEYLAFAAHYRFEPRPVAVARGNEKGRVERSIRYIRENFFAARTFNDVEDLNIQAQHWCDGYALERPWPQSKDITVNDAFSAEAPTLLPLPEHAYLFGERMTVQAGKTPYIRFDLNDYSIPHTHVQRTLTVWASAQQIRIMDAATLIAEHLRSYGRSEQIENPVHIQGLVQRKHHAHQQRAIDRLTQAVPAMAELLKMAATKGHSLGGITTSMMHILERYTAQEVQQAVLIAIARDVPHPNAVRLALETAREEQNKLPPIQLALSERARSRDAIIQPHALNMYDQVSPPPTGDTV